ncbi:MAG: hypothetical protein ACTSO9_13595 [Candidatus Helarchaeota archaeon]
MADFVLGILISVGTGVSFSLSTILTKIGARKFRGNLGPKIKQNIIFAAQMALLNTFFIIGLLISVIGTVGKLAAPLVGNSTIAITIIYSSNYIAIIILGKILIDEEVSKLEIIAVILLILAIVLVSVGVLTAGGPF